MNDEVIIRVEDLSKVFGPNPSRAFPLIEMGLSKEEILERTGCVVAINGASFEVRRGEIFVVMGLSGSGKSTMIRCLNRLIEPSRGRVVVRGSDVMELDQSALRGLRRTTMSMVFQHFGLLPQRTVLKNVEFGLEISGVEPAERIRQAEAALELVGLKGYEHSMPHELSGGMQQRVGLARALANDPEVLLMDEAFSALDPLIRAQMQDELLTLQEKMHKTVVFITHDLDEALKIGDRIAILGPGGTVRQIGSPEDILTEPADDYVERFVENVDRSKVLTAASVMRTADPVVTTKDGPSVAVRRMEQKGQSWVFVIDGHRVLRGVVDVKDAVKIRHEKSVDPIVRLEDVHTTLPDTPLADLLTTAYESAYPIAVVEENWRLLGLVDLATIIAEVGSDTECTRPLSEQNGSAGQEVAP
jgi:glycine betaine/proline transport system ATP-binding protein